MTLHIGIAARSQVIQGGDRQVSSIKSGVMTEWEPAANKTLILACRNATAVLSFAGLAFINDVSTDNWLAKAILEQELPTDPVKLRVPLMRNGSFVFTLGQVVDRVKDAIRSDFTRQSAQNRRLGLWLLMSGYTWKRPRRGRCRPRPFQVKFGYTEDASADFVKYDNNPAPRWIPPKVAAYDWIGSGSRDVQHLHHLVELLSSRSGRPEEVEGILAEHIRTVASSPGVTGVGTVCHVVSITRDQQVRVCYMRGNSSPDHVAYTPWVLGESWGLPPMYQEFGDGIEIALGPWRKLTFANEPPVTPPSGYLGIGSQIRKPWNSE